MIAILLQLLNAPVTSTAVTSAMANYINLLGEDVAFFCSVLIIHLMTGLLYVTTFTSVTTVTSLCYYYLPQLIEVLKRSTSPQLSDKLRCR